MVWYSYLFQNFPQFVVTYTVKAFHIVNEADVLLEFPCFLYDPVNIGNLTSGSSAICTPSLYSWKFLVHVVLKSCLMGFEYNLTSMQNECNCIIV